MLKSIRSSGSHWFWKGLLNCSVPCSRLLLNCFLQSSLTLALLRCIFTEGKVLYDNLDTNSLNLEALRSNITIIPQIVSLSMPLCEYRIDLSPPISSPSF
jgi:hypothetical protein